MRGIYRTLGFKLVALILVCSLVPLGATTYVSGQQATDALREASADQQAVEADRIAENTETRTAFYDKQVRLVRQHPAVKDLVRARYGNATLSQRVSQYERGAAYPALLDDTRAYDETQRYFETVAEQNPSIDMIRVFWRDGNVLSGYKLGEEDTQDYKADKKWFKSVMDRGSVGDDEVYVSAINIARSTDSPAIRYAMPLEYGGERVGLIIINYEATQITSPVTNLSIGEEGYGMLVDPNYVNAEGESLGAMYVANGKRPGLAFNQSHAGNLSIPADELAGKEGGFSYTEGGETWHAEYRRITLANGHTYYAIANVPQHQMLAAAHSIRESNILITGVAAIAVVVVGVFASRWFSDPITKLAEDAAAVAGGDMDREIRTSDVSSEISKLTRSTREMKENVVEALAEANEAREEAETARQEAEALTDHLESRAAEYNRVMSRCADGDLTQRMSPDSQSDAMRDIAHAFNDMVDDWEDVIRDLQSFADDVAASSTEVQASTEEVRNASEEVSQSVQQISDGAKTQSENLDEVVDEMSDLSATVEEIAASAETVAERSEQTAELGEDGREAAATAISEMHAVEERTQATVERVQGLNDQIETIGEIIEVISDIAEQTNLLALNANIEAARADGDGDGFGVVASEVKALAQESQESAAEIESVIEEIQAESAETVAEVAEMEERIEQGVETVEDAVESLEAVIENVEETDSGIREIDAATSSQADSTQEVMSMAEDVASISEETTAESENVAAAAEEQASALNEVTSTVSSLSEQAEDLNRILDEFEVDDAALTTSGGVGQSAATDGGRN